MAKFTAGVDLNLRLPGGFEAIGVAGTTHRIPDSLVEEFSRDQVPIIPGGVTWITQDDASSIPSLPISQANVSNLTSDLAGKYDKTGGAISGSATVTGTLGVTGLATLGAVIANAITATASVRSRDIGTVIYADQYSSIQAAIDVAPASGATVFIPVATYIITTALSVKSNLTLHGAGPGAILQAPSSTPISLIHGSSTTNVLIRDLTIDGNQASRGGAAAADGINFDGDAVNCVVQNCYVTRTARDGIRLGEASGGGTARGCAAIGNYIESPGEDGISLNGIEHRIIGNHLRNVWGDGILFNNFNERATIIGNTLEICGTGDTANPGAGISINLAKGATVTGNTIKTTGGAGIYASFATACAIIANNVLSAGVAGVQISNSINCIVVGNIIDHPAAQGIVTGGASVSPVGTIIADNVLFATGGSLASIDLQGGARTQVRGNMISDGAARAISSVVADAVIIGNTISGVTLSAAPGIRISGADTICSKNRIAGVAGSGIWTTGARSIIEGNSISGSGERGILVASADDGVVANNMVKDSTLEGILLSDALRWSVTGNRSTGASQTYGIRSTGTADYNAIVGNVLRTNATANLALSGSNNVAGDNVDAYIGSATFDPTSLADGAGQTTTVTVTGAALGDYAEASFSLNLQGITVTAWVSAADTVSVRFQNESGGLLDLASGTLKARVKKG